MHTGILRKIYNPKMCLTLDKPFRRQLFTTTNDKSSEKLKDNSAFHNMFMSG